MLSSVVGFFNTCLSSVEARLHAAQRLRGLRKVRLLFEREAVMPGRFEQAAAHLINATEVEMREGVGFVARSPKSALEPANAGPDVSLRDQITSDVVVRIAERLVQANRFQAFLYRLVITALKAIDPAEKE